MISAILALSFLGVSVRTATSQPLSSVCPKTMDTVPNFDVTQYAGLWYEHARFFDPAQIGTKCVTSEYTLQDDGTAYIWNRGLDASTKAPRAMKAVARIPDKADASKLKISFPFIRKTIPEVNYWILATDFENYSVVFTCKQLTPNTNRIRSWILTRDRHPSQKIIKTAKSAAAFHGLDTSLYLTTDQTDCEN